MNSLETKIPPPIVALAILLIMWVVDRIFPDFYIHPFLRFICAVLCFVIAGGLIVSGVGAFKKANTTVNPLTPHAATTLVVDGVYKITRNPMYAGLFLVLLGCGVILSNAFSILATFGFVMYMSKYQIEPEEKAMRELFGEEFEDYCRRVRRWF